MTLVPSSSRPSGGGSMPAKEGYYFGNQSIDPGGTGGPISFGTLHSGDAVLDVTDPLNPLAAFSGLYIFNLTINTDHSEAGKGGDFYVQAGPRFASMLMPLDGLDLDMSTHADPQLEITLIAKLTAGDAISTSFTHNATLAMIVTPEANVCVFPT